MKKQVFYIHGGDSYGQAEDFLQSLKTNQIWDLPGSIAPLSWKKTLSADLGEDYEVFMPMMPNKQNAHYEEWKVWFERHFEYLHAGVILIGHSLGGMFLAKYLSENKLPFTVKAVFLLAAPCGTYFDENGNDCGTFQFLPGNLAKLAEYKDKIEIWHSKDDYVVPFEHALEYKKQLPAAKLVTFEDKNHFLLPELPELLASIRSK